MAKPVIWSLRAQDDRKQILEYWRQRNQSNTYSKKLNELFQESIKIIANFPLIGELTSDKKARVKVVRDYLIIYEETVDEIRILTIWDSRQDPDRLRKVLK